MTSRRFAAIAARYIDQILDYLATHAVLEPEDSASPPG